jgi:hypothetical protein
MQSRNRSGLTAKHSLRCRRPSWSQESRRLWFRAGSVTRALSRYSISTWKVKEGLPYATAYHSPSAPIMKYTSCW